MKIENCREGKARFQQFRPQIVTSCGAVSMSGSLGFVYRAKLRRAMRASRNYGKVTK